MPMPMPLIRLLKNPSLWTQVWYADDASACGKLCHLRQWFDLLLDVGPGFGYFPNPQKSSIVVGPASRSAAERLFGSLGVEVVCDHRFFGGFLGNVSARDAFICKAPRLTSGCLISSTCLIWLSRSPKLLMLHSLNLCSVSGSFSNVSSQSATHCLQNWRPPSFRFFSQLCLVVK